MKVMNQKGYTLIELVVVVTIFGFLIMVSAVGFSVFFSKFRELSKWAELQKSAFECVMTIKNGISVGTGTNQQFYGVANAVQLSIEGVNAVSGTSIVCKPPAHDAANIHDQVRFFWDGNYVRATYRYGQLSTSYPIYVFPQFKRDNDIRVSKFRFTKVNSGPETEVIQLEFEAEMKISPTKTKTVAYVTKMTTIK